ncbi:MAG TPA: aminopeptidase P family protein, partial [Candidatus Bathyarchaeota archaeon]|nr:aminopeptidase P family protein [Candidatus Bathyarchaeota archaeon]
MQKNNVDVVLITREPNILYFTGFRGGVYLLVPLDEEPTLYVYGVDYEAAREELSGIDVKLLRYEDDPNKIVSERVMELGCKTVGFDLLDTKTYKKLEKFLGTKAELREVDEAIWSLRTVKDREELKLMAEAARLTELGLEAALEALRPGVREYEVAAEAEYAMRRH